MCAQFDLKILANALSLTYGVQVPEDFAFEQRVTPHSLSPVITNQGLKLMKFSLLPSWSKEPKVKFATHNARIETIDEKATWKVPFQKNHCLVPISQFIEPIYLNEHAGHMVAFSHAENQILTAAGIYDTWVNKETGEIIESFSIITTEPAAFIENIGHDRSPIFLKPSSFSAWLNSPPQSSQALKKLLMDHHFVPDLKVHRDRAMRPGWEKRVPG